MKMLKSLHKFFFKEWNEFISVPLGIALFFLFPYMLRFFDSTTAAYDAGVLHSYIAAVAGMLIIHGFAWLLLKISFPKIYEFFDDAFENHIENSTGYSSHNTLSIWQKCVLSLSLFSLYLLGTILLAKIF